MFSSIIDGISVGLIPILIAVIILFGLYKKVDVYASFISGALEGFTTVILLQLLIGSILMICLGIIGYYIAKIYEEIKDRPRYIVADRCEGQTHEEQAETDL